MLISNTNNHTLTNHTKGSTGLEHTHNGNNEVNTSVSVNHHHILSLNTIGHQIMGDCVGSIMDLLVVVSDSSVWFIQGFHNTGTLRMLVGIGGEDIGNGASPLWPMQIRSGVRQWRALGSRVREWDLADSEILRLGTSFNQGSQLRKEIFNTSRREQDLVIYNTDGDRSKEGGSKRGGLLGRGDEHGQIWAGRATGQMVLRRCVDFVVETNTAERTSAVRICVLVHGFIELVKRHFLL